MKKILLLIILYLNSIQYSISIPCRGDCPEHEWIGRDSGYLTPFSDCPQCQIKIWYWYRVHDCESIRYKEVQLHYLYVRPVCYDCGYHTRDILSYVLRWMLLNAPWPRSCPPGDYNVRATLASCWTSDENDNIISCPEPDCCWQTYYICNGNIFLLSRSNYIRCNDYQGQTCLFLCDLLPLPITYPDKDKFDKLNSYNINFSKLDKSSSVIPNPANSYIKIEFKHFTNGDYSLEIFNEFEKRINIKNLYFEDDSQSFVVNTDTFNTGVYFYQIKSREKIISAGKFVIIK